jgi:catechol 2,3-dioxygenase
MVTARKYYETNTSRRHLISPATSQSSFDDLCGVPVRRIDHVNLMVSDVVGNTDFAMNTLGFLLREQKIGDGGAVVGSWLSVSAVQSWR